MFESANLDHRVSKGTYKRDEPKLRAALLDAQYEVKQQGRFAVLILIVCDMVDRTSTLIASWTLVEANNKYYARIKVLKTVCKALEDAL